MRKSGVLFGAFLFLLSSCNNSQGESPSPSPDGGDEEPPIVIETEIKQDEIKVTNNIEDLEKIFKYSNTDKYLDSIPLVEGEKYSYYWSIDSQTEIPYSFISVYGVNEKYIEEDYKRALVHYGYAIASNNLYGFKDVTYTDDLIIQFELIQDEDETYHFDLLIYTFKSRVEEFPSDVIKYYYNEDLLKLDAKAYDYSLNYGKFSELELSIYCYYTEVNTLSTYISKLKDYKVTENSGIYTLNRDDLMLDITLYQYEEDIIYMKVSSMYPYSYIMAYIERDLPRLDKEEYSAIDFSFITLSDNTESLAVYYDGTTLSTYYRYLELLKSNGFTFEKENNYESNGKMYYTSSFYLNKGLNNEHYLEVLYSVEQSSMCIALYQN